VPEIIALKADTECATITFPQCQLGAPWRKDTTTVLALSQIGIETGLVSSI